MCSSDNKGTPDCGHDVGRLINTLSHQLKRQMCVQEEEDSLTTNMQRLVLHYILFQSLQRDIYQKDVEKEFQIRRSTATGTLQILEKNGFITREPVKQDARLKKLMPTEKAKAVRQHILDNIRYVEELLAKDIPEEKLTVCREVLMQMSENLSGDEKRREEITDHE
ncbi:MAG TPA: MarR family winged helix-turn-helix transcriptional regulator [Candidatus Mediterraneibacter faecavium]|uniref:MarR family winged helix-turn-helix transcriptional regulator n=1 Tax=Candidatus Mediterraneibacter faecavium TaxID=2838668 RepID=A0A9D2QA28_9FIRM|nr:MarR family winged helix-turn-helix transcriptional regulator [Candidatus Mediterraneibacter faecavium]